MSRTKKGLIPLTVRLTPAIYKKLKSEVVKHPHLSINIIVNDILDKNIGGAA